MEKICSWLWRPVKGKPQQEDAYYYDPIEPPVVLIARNGYLPPRSEVEKLRKHGRKASDSGYPARELYFFLLMKVKAGKKLRENTMNLFDFLNHKLGETQWQANHK